MASVSPRTDVCQYQGKLFLNIPVDSHVRTDIYIDLRIAFVLDKK